MSLRIPNAVMDRLESGRLLPVIVIDDPADAPPLGAALREAGVTIVEITLRTSGSAEALARLVEAEPTLVVGAGTVLDRVQAQHARDAGARFVVSPGLVPEVIEYCEAHRLDVIPGVATPTEIIAALRRGLIVQKLFPAAALGGPDYLRAVAAPFPGLRFVPTGGIDEGSLARYLELPAVIACGGSWLAPQSWIRAREFDRIAETTRRAVAIASRAPRGRG